MVRCLIVILLCCLILPVLAIAGGNSDKFVDFDGDGINDNIVDLDNNKIPDQFQQQVHIVVPATSSSLPAFFNHPGIQQDSETEYKIPMADKFLLRKYVCRLLTSCRDNFESDFNSTKSNNTSSGSSCAGGICF